MTATSSNRGSEGPYEPPTDLEATYVWCVTRRCDRKSALIGRNRTHAQRAELTRELIRECGIADEIAEMPGDELVSFKHWWNGIFANRKSLGTAKQSVTA